MVPVRKHPYKLRELQNLWQIHPIFMPCSGVIPLAHRIAEEQEELEIHQGAFCGSLILNVTEAVQNSLINCEKILNIFLVENIEISYLSHPLTIYKKAHCPDDGMKNILKYWLRRGYRTEGLRGSSKKTSLQIERPSNSLANTSYFYAM